MMPDPAGYSRAAVIGWVAADEPLIGWKLLWILYV